MKKLVIFGDIFVVVNEIEICVCILYEKLNFYECIL